MFSGYKTYVAAVFSIVGALAAVYTGHSDWNTAVQIIQTAIMGAFIRHGVSNL